MSKSKRKSSKIKSIEEEYETLLQSLFGTLREEVRFGGMDEKEGETLYQMIKDRLKIEDPNPSLGWDNSGCSW
jgi:hypothetical protein